MALAPMRDKNMDDARKLEKELAPKIYSKDIQRNEFLLMYLLESRKQQIDELQKEVSEMREVFAGISKFTVPRSVMYGSGLI